MLKIKCTKKGYTKKVSRDEYMQQTKDLKRCDSDILVTREKLAQLLQKGYAVILAEFNKYNSINIDNIKGVQLLALDVDESKKITMKEMIKKLEEDLNITPVIAYCTFSDTDNTRFRLIYRLEKTLSSKEYTAVYKEFVKRYSDFIDNQPINANRIWQGTNKKVYVNKQDKAITKELIEEFIKATNKKNKQVVSYVPKNTQRIKFNDEILNKVYIDSQYKGEIVDIIQNSISLHDFIRDNFGGVFVQRGNRYVGCCPLHGGDNKGAFSIFTNTNTYTCFTHCGTGNIITLAYKVYNTNDFTSVVLQLIQDYNISIPEKSIKVKRR